MTKTLVTKLRIKLHKKQKPRMKLVLKMSKRWRISIKMISKQELSKLNRQMNSNLIQRSQLSSPRNHKRRKFSLNKTI